MGKCICEGGVETGPNTYRRVVHLSSCPHSTLRETTKPYRPRRIRRVLGTRRLVTEVATPVTRTALPRRRRDLTGEIVRED